MRSSPRRRARWCRTAEAGRHDAVPSRASTASCSAPRPRPRSPAGAGRGCAAARGHDLGGDEPRSSDPTVPPPERDRLVTRVATLRRCRRAHVAEAVVDRYAAELGHEAASGPRCSRDVEMQVPLRRVLEARDRRTARRSRISSRGRHPDAVRSTRSTSRSRSTPSTSTAGASSSGTTTTRRPPRPGAPRRVGGSSRADGHAGLGCVSDDPRVRSRVRRTRRPTRCSRRQQDYWRSYLSRRRRDAAGGPRTRSTSGDTVVERAACDRGVQLDRRVREPRIEPARRRPARASPRAADRAGAHRAGPRPRRRRALGSGDPQRTLDVARRARPPRPPRCHRDRPTRCGPSRTASTTRAPGDQRHAAGPSRS